jgi:hypothetical protein
MTTLVIGGDHIDAIRRELAEHGLHDVEHWVGRKPADSRKSIPDRIRLVIAVTDQLSHSMLYSASISATRKGLPIIYTRRSAHELREKLTERFGEAPGKIVYKPVSAGWVLPFSKAALSY